MSFTIQSTSPLNEDEIYLTLPINGAPHQISITEARHLMSTLEELFGVQQPMYIPQFYPTEMPPGTWITHANHYNANVAIPNP